MDVDGNNEKRIGTRDFAENNNYDPELLFNKVFFNFYDLLN